MTNFPIELIPHEIEQAKLAKPPVPPCSAIEPRPPINPYQIEIPLPAKRLDKRIVFIGLAVSIPLSYLIGNLLHVPVMATFLMLLTAIGLYVSYEIITYPSRKKERECNVERIEKSNQKEQSRFQTGLEKYRGDRVIYEFANQDYQREIAEILTPENVEKFQFNQIRERLKATISFDASDGDAQAGYCEKRFGRSLVSHFSSERIKTGLTLEIPNWDFPYSPDFVYIDPSSKLHIDIEIDEPYVFNNGKPTHYLYADRDENRNAFFLKKGWIVIRFAEEQIVKYPNECCKLIAETIYKYGGDGSFMTRFSGVQHLTSIRQWTEEEAIEMALNNYRDTYTAICRNR